MELQFHYTLLLLLLMSAMAASKQHDIHRKIGELIEEAVKLSLSKQVIGEAYFPARSCKEIAKLRPGLPAGYYWVKSSNGSAIQVYCDGAWTRAAYLNMTDPTHTCPATWKEIAEPRRTCSKTGSTYTCSSALFPTYGVPYKLVHGRVIAYQHGRTYAFTYYDQNPATATIDTYYLDGISITRGAPRQHIWSFAADLCEGCSLCPCQSSNRAAPPWVGENYFCESGTRSVPRPPFPDDLFFEEDRLWDGEGCGSQEEVCCKFNNPPWFTRELTEAATDDIEVRNCGTINTTQDVPVELIEIYIQ